MALGSEVPEDTMARQATDEDAASGKDEGGEEWFNDGREPAASSSVRRPSNPGPEVFSLLEDDDLEVELPLQQEPSRWLRLLRHIVWLLFVCALVAGATCWGVHIGTQQQRQLQLERELEAKNTEAAVVQSGADVTEDKTGECIVDVAVDQKGHRLELQRLSGEKTSISLPRSVELAPARSTASKGGDPVSTTASEGGDPVSIDSGEPVASPAVVTNHVEPDNEYPELACRKTKHVEWLEIKKAIGSLFGSWNSGAVSMDKVELHEHLEVAIVRLQAVHHQIDECGMGRLCMTLFALAAGEAGGSLRSTPSLHSPLLTILLDVPWSHIMRSGWPLFGMLAQLHLQQHQKDDLPTKGRSAEYFQALQSSLLDQQPDVLASIGAEFVKRQEEAGHADDPHTGVMPALCALASQLLGQGLLLDGARAEEVLRHMQSFFKQAVNNIDDLQSTIDSAWPLYGVLNAAAMQLAADR